MIAQTTAVEILKALEGANGLALELRLIGKSGLNGRDEHILENAALHLEQLHALATDLAGVVG